MPSHDTDQPKPSHDASHKSGHKAHQSNVDVPKTGSIPPSPPPKPHYEITCKKEKDFWEKFKERAEIGGIFLLAIYTGFTIAIWWTSKRSADAAKNSADTASTSLKIGGRAYLYIRSVETQRNADSTQYTLTVENSGHMACNGFTAEISEVAYIQNNQKQAPVNFSTYQYFYGTEQTDISPGNSNRIVFPGPPMTPLQWEDIDAGNADWLVAGNIYWGDGFGRIQQGGFCFHHNPHSTISWSPCAVTGQVSHIVAKAAFDSMQRAYQNQPKESQ